VEVFIQTVKEYRLLLVLRARGLSGEVSDTDPQDVGRFPAEAEPLSAGAEKTAELVRGFLEQARHVLVDHLPANGVLLRGFSQRPSWPRLSEVYGVRTAAIAAYPMYRGVAQLLGMHVLSTGSTFKEEVATLQEQWDDYDFFFLHAKHADSAGEDGDFEGKVAVIEEVDALVPKVLELEPDVVVVTGDHSTPAALRSHSWHPVPVLLWSRLCRADAVSVFGERACLAGGLGTRLPATDLMGFVLANAGRLRKFGA
jgi:2,3-bisphosphoglycerate-independent phosphoglycerate mutase